MLELDGTLSNVVEKDVRGGLEASLRGLQVRRTSTFFGRRQRKLGTFDNLDSWRVAVSASLVNGQKNGSSSDSRDKAFETTRLEVPLVSCVSSESYNRSCTVAFSTLSPLSLSNQPASRPLRQAAHRDEKALNLEKTATMLFTSCVLRLNLRTPVEVLI